MNVSRGENIFTNKFKNKIYFEIELFPIFLIGGGRGVEKKVNLEHDKPPVRKERLRKLTSICRR